MKDIFYEVNVQYSKKIHELHSDLLFLSERMKIGNVERLVTNLYDKNKYVIHIGNLKLTLNHGLVLKKFIEKLNLIKKISENLILI